MYSSEFIAITTRKLSCIHFSVNFKDSDTT